MRVNGLDFHVEVEGEGPPLLLLHGFTGSLRSWDLVRPALSERAKLILVDLIGHGDSAAPHDPERYTLDWAVRDLLTVIDQVALHSVALLGYSMGGRVALRFAIDCPDRVTTLLLESASPGIADPAQRRQRLHADLALAERIEQVGVPSFVREWEQQPLLALAEQVSSEVRMSQREQRLRTSPMGLANSLRGMGSGRQTPLWDFLPALQVPVRLIVGERDPRYRDIVSRMQSLLPNAKLTVSPEAGHTVHLDQPARFVDWAVA